MGPKEKVYFSGRKWERSHVRGRKRRERKTTQPQLVNPIATPWNLSPGELLKYIGNKLKTNGNKYV